MWSLPPPLDLMARFTSDHMDKKLYAINGKTGAKLWEFESGR
jgi:outer membrane protein assembly factor BamB